MLLRFVSAAIVVALVVFGGSPTRAQVGCDAPLPIAGTAEVCSEIADLATMIAQARDMGISEESVERRAGSIDPTVTKAGGQRLIKCLVVKIYGSQTLASEWRKSLIDNCGDSSVRAHRHALTDDQITVCAENGANAYWLEAWHASGVSLNMVIANLKKAKRPDMIDFAEEIYAGPSPRTPDQAMRETLKSCQKSLSMDWKIVRLPDGTRVCVSSGGDRVPASECE